MNNLSLKWNKLRFHSKFFKVLIISLAISIFNLDTKVFANDEEKGLQQEILVTGLVTSSDDQTPIVGANVYIKGTTNGTTTNLEGEFSIAVPSNESVIVISYIGYITKEIVVGNQSTINIAITPDIASLEQIVVVGYGTKKKETLTGSIETVSSETFEDRALTSPSLALQGVTPGLVVTRSSSQPGNEGLDFTIRGATSVNGGEPLIVIDGSPALNSSSFYSMNPDDIESISILKDASASVYGSRAANGVILVTTKRGKGKFKVNVSSSVTYNTIGITPLTPSMEDYATVWLEAAEQDGDQANYWGWLNKDNLLKMQQGYSGILTTAYWDNVYVSHVDRYNEMYGNSMSSNQNISLTGSTDKSNYRFSAGHTDERGMLQTSYDGKVKYNTLLNYDSKVSDWLRLETNISYFNTHVSSPSTGLWVNAIAFDPPFFPSVNPYGQWYGNFNTIGGRNAVASTVDGGRKNINRDQLKLNFAANIDIYRGLSFKGTASIDKEFYDYQKTVITVQNYDWYGNLAQYHINGESSITQKRVNTTYQTYGGFFNYTKDFNAHKLSAMVGMTSELRQEISLEGYRKGFEDYGVYDLNLGSTEENVTANGGNSIWGLYSYISTLNYSYKNKYLIDLNWRRDGSSRFDEGYKWVNYGGGSAAWILSEEDFMKAINPISFLKLRISYGEMGNQVGISNFNYLSSMSFGSAIFGSTRANQNSAWVNGITSNVATWERVSTITYGVDFRLFESKVFGSFDYFTKTNDGMLININYPDLLGGTAPKSNSGKLETKGWEAILGFRNSVGDLRYNVSVNIGDSRDELVKMDGVNTYVPGKNNKVQGYPLNSWFMFETDGFFANEDEVTAYYEAYNNGGIIPSATDLNQRLRPGDVKIVDKDNSGSITNNGDIEEKNADLIFMGDASPHYYFGINLGAKYQKFDLSMLFQGVLQQYVERSGYLAYPFRATWTNQTNAYIGKTWTAENTGAEYPRMTSNTTRARWNWQHNDFMLQNNRYLRMKSLIVGYTFGNLQIAKYNIERFRIYFSGNDLFEFTSVKDGYDPEYGESSNNTYPLSRNYSIGLNLTF